MVTGRRLLVAGVAFGSGASSAAGSLTIDTFQAVGRLEEGAIMDELICEGPRWRDLQPPRLWAFRHRAALLA